MRRQAYEYFATFLKFLRSHSTLDLMTSSKSSVSNDLDVLKMYGFRGEWFDRLVLRLNHHSSLDISDKEMQNLTQDEDDYYRRIVALDEEYAALTRKLYENRSKHLAEREAVEYVSNKKNKIMDERARLNVPFII